MQRRSRKPGAHDIAAEIIRRAASEDGRPRYVVRLSEPPTLAERLQLMQRGWNAGRSRSCRTSATAWKSGWRAMAT
jgi:hypothetical protein